MILNLRSACSGLTNLRARKAGSRRCKAGVILAPVASDLPIWKEAPRGAYPDLRIFQLPGPDFDLAIERGKFPRAPLFYLTGVWITDADQRRRLQDQGPDPRGRQKKPDDEDPDHQGRDRE